MRRRGLAALALVSCTCMKELPRSEAVDANSGAPAASATEAKLSSPAADPPPPDGFVMPKVFGDDPPRSGPFERSSHWVVTTAKGSVQHDIPDDTLRYPELREVLRCMFAGPPAPDPTRVPTARTREQLRIEWREHGNTTAISRLLDDGTLVRDQNGKTSVDRRLSPEALTELNAAIERAGLSTPGRRFREETGP